MDDRQFQWQPDCQRSREDAAHEDEGEAGSKRHEHGAHKDGHDSDPQHSPVAEDVAEFGQNRYADTCGQRLHGDEPGDRYIGDAEVVADIAQQRYVVALQETAGEFDEDEEANDRQHTFL